MKTNKTSLGIVLILMMTLFACAQKYDPENDFYVSSMNDEKSIQINRYKGLNWTSVEIPSKIRNLPVTHIGDSAYQSKYLYGVTIPDSVTQIKSYAFAYNQLSSVTIPGSVTQIKNYAFAGNKLASVIIPGNVTQIERGIFADNELTQITIPNSVTKIKEGAFANNKLSSVTIPESITEIGPGAFYQNHLISITIGENVVLGYQGRDGYEPTFNRSFDSFYRSNKSQAGTYILNNGSWTYM